MKETDSIDEFAGRISNLENKFNELGATMDVATLVKKLFISVPNRFLQVVTSVENLFDVDAMLFDEAISRLKAYEECIRKEDSQGD